MTHKFNQVQILSEHTDSIVYLANTDFELELSRGYSSFEEDWLKHPLCLQLQFLPILFAKPTDFIAVTHLPDQNYLNLLQSAEFLKEGLPTFICFSDSIPKNLACFPWGSSKKVKDWADSKKLLFPFSTNWEIIREINSKQFSFSHYRLPNAFLIYNDSELKTYLKEFKGSHVLKTFFGLSGKGNRRISGISVSPQTFSFCKNEWDLGRPLIIEPWLNRQLDFSTQWIIENDGTIQYLGVTQFETDQKGIYQATIVGPDSFLDSYAHFLDLHKIEALKVLREIAKKGYIGPIGIDAFIYKCSQSNGLVVHPLVEINARQTMSSAALQFQRRHYPTKTVRLSYCNRTVESSTLFSLLPSFLIKNDGTRINFRQMLTIEVL